MVRISNILSHFEGARTIQRWICVVAIVAVWSVHPLQAQLFTTSGADIYNTNSGNVGIGTSTPAAKLSINGPTISEGTIWSYGTDGAFFAVDRSNGSGIGGFYRDGDVNRFWDNAGGDILAYTPAGNVGIGTMGPGVKLQVVGASSSRVQITLTDGNTASAMITAGASTAAVFGSDRGINFRTGAAYLNADSSGTTVMSLTTDGKVGVGTTSPSTALHVVGDLTVTGNIAARYQDVAEWVPTSQALHAGTVVVLDTSHSNQVIASGKEYDTTVAGVISVQPGIILGEGGEGRVLVATTGRVIVRVDASSSPIQVGDLLVTSDKEGVAKKSEPLSLGGVPIHRPGTLIGKALEPLRSGEGEILVLLSLQ